jgi:hypothetical protein
VQTGLSVEEHGVSVAQMSLYHISDGKFVRDLAPVCVLQINLYWAIGCHVLMNFDIVSSGVIFGAISHKLFELFYVIAVNSLWVG